MNICRIRNVAIAISFAMLAMLGFSAPRADAALTLGGAVPTGYSYGLSWSPHERLLTGRGSIHVSNQSATPMQSVWLRLRPNYPTEPERISDLRGARINGHAAGRSMLRLRLDSPVAPGRGVRFYFKLRLRVPSAATSLGRSAGIDLFGDALPVVAVTGPRGLRIGPEPSYGEGSFNPVAYWQVRLKMPRGLRPVLPGLVNRVSSTRHSTSYTSLARVRDMAFAVGPLVSRSARVQGRLITVVSSPSRQSALPAALRRAVNAFRKMQGWYGGYRLPNLKVVIGDLKFGGSEYPGVVFSTADNATIAHEVAHQWFYGLVGNDQYNDPFLDESLTAFSEQQFHKSYRCDLARPIRGLHGLGTGMSYWEKHAKAYEDTIYRGGACALTVLQRDIGKATFRKALRAYVAANEDKIAGVDDFLAAIQAAAPNYDLARWEKLVGLS